MKDESSLERAGIAQAVGTVGLATFISRILGFIRDVVLASFFGTGMFADAFFVAFRIPNLLRRLVGEGSLTVSFIPVFTEYLTEKSKSEAFRLANAALTLAVLFLLLITLAGIVLSPLIVRAMAQGFAANPDKFSLTILLNRLMFPYIFFIGLAALVMGILNSLHRFGPSALAPVFLNLALIFSALILAKQFDQPVLALAVGVILGGILQLGFQLIFLIREGFRFRFLLDFRHPGVVKIATLMGPSVFGLGVAQINVLVTTLLASFLAEGSVSYLYYANRLVEFPLGVFAVAVATVVLPTLSAQAAKRDHASLQSTLNFGLRLTLFTTLPAMVGLIVLRQPIIELLFQRGAFTATSTILTAEALLFYSLGLWAFAGVRVIVPAFYALKDTVTPVKVAALALAANLVLSLVLMGPLRHGGLALATSSASVLNFCLLAFILVRRLGNVQLAELGYSILRVALACVPMGLTAFFLGGENHINLFGGNLDRLLNLALAILAAMGIYLLSCYILKSKELTALKQMLRLRAKRNQQ